jgi:hypothetical protein
MTTQHRAISLLLSLGLLATLAGPGCRSASEPGSTGFASVTIQNHTAQEIAATTARVFGANGYRGGASGPGQMVFEKPASRATSISREGLVGAYYGNQTINRVRVEIVQLAGGTYSLQGKAFMVTGGSDPFFQDEVPLSYARSGPYQSLLKEVQKQLK